MNIESLRYPIGKFSFPETVSAIQLNEYVEIIRKFPAHVTNAVNGLMLEILLQKYRPQGWNIIQLVHHCADSHMNSLIRFKLALTEDQPIIKTYEESEWAKLVDANNEDLTCSLNILSGVHKRWTLLLETFEQQHWQKLLVHPEMERTLSLAQMLSLYAWHCKHHLAHIELAKASKGKYND